MQITLTEHADAATTPEPIMDLRTNAIDLNLDPAKPDSRGRAMALAEDLLAYCDRHVLKEDGECLAVVDLLTRDELGKYTIADDPDCPGTALAEMDVLESPDDDLMQEPNGMTGDLFGLSPLEDADAVTAVIRPKAISAKALNQKAIKRFTGLMAESHGYGRTRAKAKRFAGAVDAGVWKRDDGSTGAKAKALLILGGQRPTDATLATLWKNAKCLDTPQARRGWVANSMISRWGGRSRRGGPGPHTGATIALCHVLDLALRVYVRQLGLEGRASDDDLGLLLGNMLFMRTSAYHQEISEQRRKVAAKLLKGYEISLSFDKDAFLLVGCKKRVQSLTSAIADQLGSASVLNLNWPLLECQAVAPSYKVDATRFAQNMDFFVVPSGTSAFTRDMRITRLMEKRGLDEARAIEENRKQEKRVLSSGLVVANRAQDLVEECLEQALGADPWTPRRFRPTETRQVAVSTRGKRAEAQFLLEPLPGLQVFYDENIQADSRLEQIHKGLMTVFKVNGLFGVGVNTDTKPFVTRLQSMADADPSLPVLVVQIARKIRTPRGVTVLESAWFKENDKAMVPLFGGVTNKALAHGEKQRERKDSYGWTVDAYTQAKLDLYDTPYGRWRALQGLNLDDWEMDHLARGRYLELNRWMRSGSVEGNKAQAKKEFSKGEVDKINVFLYKLVNTFHEIKYKHRLSHSQDFPLGTAWQSGKKGVAAVVSAQPFVCLYAQCPKGAPARVGIVEYWLKAGVLHLGEVATATYRMPKAERNAEAKQTAVRRAEIGKAYTQALAQCKANWASALRRFMVDLTRQESNLNESLMVFSPADNHLLREDEGSGVGDWKLLGATWKGFPFQSILRDGRVDPKTGELRPHLTREKGEAMAQQMLPVKDADVLLEPDSKRVRGIRVIRSVQATSKHNNPLITWEVLTRERGTGRIDLVDNPHETPVFGAFIATLTDDLVRTGAVSRTPLPGKLVKMLVRN